MRGLHEGSEVEPGAGEEVGQQPGAYCMRLRRLFTSAVSSVMVCLVRLARDLSRWDHTGSTGVSSWAYGGSRYTVSHGPGRHDLRHRGADVGVEIVPDQHDGAVARGRRQLPTASVVGNPLEPWRPEFGGSWFLDLLPVAAIRASSAAVGPPGGRGLDPD